MEKTLSMNNRPVIVITGPTATGKTALSVALAEKIGAEVISADSMQIYRGMDIGTAKVRPEETRGIKHHLVDMADPRENYSAARWVEEATAAADDICSRGLFPIVAGGTGLYIDSLLAGRDFGAAPGDSGLRERLSEEYDALGAEALWNRLRDCDPERAAILAPADKKRVLRALEVFLLTGETITEHDRKSRLQPPRFASCRFALTYRDRERLYERINLRVDLMEKEGLFEEVRRLLDSGVPANATAMQAIGYKEVAACLRGECTREEALEKVKMESRRYAKRQLTWLRRDEELTWLEREDYPTTEDALEKLLSVLRERGCIT